MLVGREPERARIDALLGRARAGQGAALIVRGDPGIGKTTLLTYAGERAEGMRVLRARGVEAEAELAFSALHELLRPLLEFMREIPALQAEALRGALGLGPPVDARMLIAGGVLSLLAAAGDAGPVLLLVDDAQWLDRESADALVFVARRLEFDPIVLLFGARDGDPRVFEPERVDGLVLTGLEWDEASVLLAGRGLADGVVDGLYRAAGGNPLALVELPGALSAAQRAGEEPLADPLPVTPALQAAFARRIEELPEWTRLALVVAAAEPSFELRPIAMACTGIDVDAAALEEAEGAGLVSLADGRVAFRHPLVCAAAYHGAPGAQRRVVHRALAAAWEADGETDRRAWHLAAAALGPDEEVAAALEHVGNEAVRRSGYGAAVAAFERAAALTPDRGPRARRLYRAVEAIFATAAMASGTIPLLDRASAAAGDDPKLRFDITSLRSTIAAMADPHEGRRLMLEEADRLAGDDARRAAVLATHAARFATEAGEPREALDDALRARALLGDDAPPGMFLLVVHGIALLDSGCVEEAVPLLQSAVELGRECELEYASLLAGRPLTKRMNERVFEAWTAVQALLVTGDTDSALALVNANLAANRPRGVQIGFLQAWAGRIELEQGRWTSASSHLRDGVRICSAIRYYNAWWCGCVALAELAAARGAGDDVERYTTEALRAEAGWGSMRSIAWLGGGGPGLLALGSCHFEESADAYERLVLGRVGALKLYPQIADAIEALVRSGRTGSAATLLEEFAGQAEASGWGWALARSAHLEAVLEPSREAFERALGLHEQAGRPFPQARTRLAFGEWLRRGGRRVDARVQLHGALESFERLGAEPWAEQARGELRATGERVRRRSSSAVSELTSQELQVASVVARGATNKEAAAQLYLSPKTIEKHLGSVYAKLGVRSRTELASLVANDQPLVAVR